MLTVLLLMTVLVHNHAGEGLRVSGSSTAAPVIAEAIAGAGIEDIGVFPTGTVRGFEELCVERSVSMIGASRRVLPEELAACQDHGMGELYEVQLGLDGIVLAQHRRPRLFPLALRELYLAAAFLVPENDNCVLIPNPNETWNQVNESLPNRKVRIFGPPASSGTRDIFIERAIAEGARQIDCLAELERRDPEAFERAIMPRHDEVWLDAGENDAALAIALRHVRDAVGIFGWQSFHGQTGLRALPLEGVVPDEETIASGAYPLSRPLFLYASPEAMGEPSVRSLISRFSAAGTDASVRRYSTASGAVSEIGDVDTIPGKRVYRTP